MWHFIRCMVISWSSRNVLEKKVQIWACASPCIACQPYCSIAATAAWYLKYFHCKPRPFTFFSMAKFWNLYIEFLLHANSLRISTICGRTVVKLKSPVYKYGLVVIAYPRQKLCKFAAQPHRGHIWQGSSIDRGLKSLEDPRNSPKNCCDDLPKNHYYHYHYDHHHHHHHHHHHQHQHHHHCEGQLKLTGCRENCRQSLLPWDVNRYAFPASSGSSLARGRCDLPQSLMASRTSGPWMAEREHSFPLSCCLLSSVFMLSLHPLFLPRPVVFQQFLNHCWCMFMLEILFPDPYPHQRQHRLLCVCNCLSLMQQIMSSQKLQISDRCSK